LTRRNGALLAKTAIGVAVACALTVGAGAATAGASTQQVRYGAYELRVPASWPVYDLAAHPKRCVRFDRHAVYLGRPGVDQRCPTHVVGRSETITIEPLSGAAESSRRSATIRAPRGAIAPPKLPPAAATEAQVALPAAGVLVSATWREHRGLVRRILDGARRVPGGAEPPAGGSAPTETDTAPAPQAAGARQANLGFDACGAPSRSAMSAWRASPYGAAGIYIGGVNRGCSQPNLSVGWVRDEIAAGWGLIPIYVGLQAPGSSCGSCAIIRRDHAKAQGETAARDAMRDARALGLGEGTPIYYDMEYYSRSSSNSGAALRFLAAWTTRLHRDGYVSGVYSSAGAAITDLVKRYGSSYKVPDNIWIANWNGQRTAKDPYVPDGYWGDHQRLRQYRGGHTEGYGGVRINIDNDFIDGAVAGEADDDADGVLNSFDICETVRGPATNDGCPYPSHVSGGLRRYLNSIKGDRRQGDHLVTTGGVGAAYQFQGNLGFVNEVAQPGTSQLYSCSVHGDQFVSQAADCEGDKVLGKLGYAYASPPAGVPTQAIYRCERRDGEHTVTYDATCNGATNEGRLGYTLSVSALGRYLDSIKGDRHHGDHLVTTGGVGAVYHFQGNLGFLYGIAQPGTIPLYGCSVQGDQFVSQASDCEGQKVLGALGYAYVSPPTGIPTQAIYRCQRKNGERTVSYYPACKGATNEGRLGYTISVLSLGRYYDSVSGDPNHGDHLVTSGGVGAAYHFQGNLGFLYGTAQPGTISLYSCSVHGDQFVSQASDCEGDKVLATLGYAYSSPPTGVPTQAIYRCRRKNDERFVSTKPTCNRPSNVNDGRLGYVMIAPLPG
jgi:Domain of unknown function (DUF1906)